MKGHFLIQYAIEKPKRLTLILVFITIALGALIPQVKVDTDPENMLAESEPVRVFHNQVKKEFALNDFVVLGVVNEKNPDGVFNPATLAHVHELTEFVKDLHDPDHPEMRVVTRNMIAPGTVEDIEQAGLGQVRFDWLMEKPPATRVEALKIRDQAMANPLLKGTLVSEDGKALAIYIPVSEKDFSGEVRTRLLDKIATFANAHGDAFYVTGLPVAEDTFGEEMFVQMAISAPLAMVVIFLLMFYFFRNVRLIIAPMIVAMMAVLSSMGLLIGTGHTLHIMSSMIPIFLMPIAVVDSIHILSEFFDSYPSIRDRKQTLLKVMRHLFMPMLYTSLTSAAGFASLALTPIPPVRAFGIFVAIGILLAWLFTILFIPAYIMMTPEARLKNFGQPSKNSVPSASLLSRSLTKIGRFTYTQAKLIIVLTVIAGLLAAYGISQIQVNDNPVKWFTKSHSIRVADKVLNHHFGGTYEAYLVFEAPQVEENTATTAKWIQTRINEVVGQSETEMPLYKQAMEDLALVGKNSETPEVLIADLTALWEAQLDTAPDEHYDIWADLVAILDESDQRSEVFKRPDVLEYIVQLQYHLTQTDVVGKSNAITGVVKKVHQELFEGDPAYFRIPDSTGAVAESLISFQNSHKPDDLWHFVTPDYTKANVWLQLKKGDNQVMEKVVNAVDTFVADNPPPVELKHQWAGLTYLNVIWQDKMVFGMAEAFLSSFAIVLIMMIILFRSFVWGLLAMIPLSVTIASIYGIIGYVGKDYDMPVAVLSSLTLGLAVDFAIHFLERARMTVAETGSWKTAIETMFEEPARAITRNVIVIAVGFMPLLAAPLVPYKTVGIFLASIMALSGIGTMLILPGLITLLDKLLFKKHLQVEVSHS